MAEDGQAASAEEPTPGADAAAGDAAEGDAAQADAGPTVVGPSDRENEPSSLFVWAAGSFHAAILVAALVAAIHLSGAAGDLLAGAGTLPGAVAYLYLWAVTLVTTRRGLRASGVTPAAGVPDRGKALVTALYWGGVTGLAFFAALFVVVAVLFLVQAGLDASIILTLLLLVGILVAALAGALAGVILGLLDLALLRAAAKLTGELNRPGA